MESGASSLKRAAVRMAFVHISGLCWRFFGYHLTICAKQAGVELVDTPVATVGGQVAEIERLLGERIDVLLFRPMATDSADLLAVLERARAQGVHLISIDGQPGGTVDICSVTADNFGGQAALAAHVFGILNGRGKVAYLQGDLRTAAGGLRNAGLHSVLSRFPAIELVFTDAFDWSESSFNFQQGMAMARTALDAHADLDAIISATDEGALGVGIVLDERGWRGKVVVAGFDGMPEGISAVHAGDLVATARQPLDTMAQQAFALALALVEGTLNGVCHYVQEVDLVTRDNVGEAALRALRIFPGVCADLNVRATAQKNSASFLETLLDMMPTMLLVKDAKDLRYLRVNRARDEWLNSPRGFQLGKTGHDLYPEDLADDYDREDYAVLASGKTLDLPAELSYLEGFGPRYTHTRKIPIFDGDGKAECLLVISEDITRQKLAAQLLAEHSVELETTRLALKKSHQRLVQAEKMAALGALVAGVSHELNTPIGNALMAVSTYAEHTRSLADKMASGLTRSMLERYLADATNGLDLLERNLRRSAELIQSFKQIAIDQTNSKPRTFCLAEVVAESLLALSPDLKKNFVIAPDIPAELMLDSFPGALERALINLVNNALIHGFEGRANGLVKIVARPAAPGWVDLVVEDDGVGIAVASIKRIFDPFYSTKFGRGGSGLGLGVVNAIVTGLLGGQVDVRSSPGQGARFTLTLPLRARNHDD